MLEEAQRRDAPDTGPMGVRPKFSRGEEDDCGLGFVQPSDPEAQVRLTCIGRAAAPFQSDYTHRRWVVEIGGGGAGRDEHSG